MAIVFIKVTLYFSEKRSCETLILHKQSIHSAIIGGEDKVAETKMEKENNPFIRALFSNNDTLYNSEAQIENFHLICETKPLKCASPFLPSHLGVLKVAPKHKLLFCPIHGNLSTFFKKVMCYLFDEEYYKVSNVTLNDDILEDDEICKLRNTIQSFKDFKIFYPNAIKSEWKLLTIVRNPIERFLSKFIEYCVKENNECNGCKANMTCFLIQQHFEIIHYNHTGLGKSSDEMMFLPQSWLAWYLYKGLANCPYMYIELH